MARKAASGSGPLCALDDPKLLEHMTRGIRLAARRRHAVSVTCWPNIEYQRHDAAGNPIRAPDTMILDAYRSCGWRHQGFDTGYGKVVNRWNWIRTFDGIKDEKTLLASYKPRTRWSVNRARTSGVRVRELGADELGTFVDIERKTAGRRGFTARDEDYYRRFKETFGSRARFMLAEIHAGELLTRLTAEYDKLAERLDLLRTQYENHPTSRIKRQEDDITRNLTAMEHRLNEARALASRGSVIPAACALFVEHRREIVYLTAGALPEYRSYQAPALLVHEECSACASTVAGCHASTCTASPAYSTTRMTRAVGCWNSSRGSTGMPRSWLEHALYRPARSDTSSAKPRTQSNY